MDIWLYTAREYGFAQAEAYEQVLRDAIAEAVRFPDHGSVLLLGKTLYRKCRAGEHAVLYRVHATAVTIVRVVHSAQDWKRRLR